jgi:hypothetical protein
MARSSALIKVALGLAVVAGLGVLFVRSAISTRAEPYTTRPEWLRNWRVVEAEPTAPTDALLALQAPDGFGSDLFRQVFSRSGESLSGPSSPAIPLVLKGEFDRALAGHVTPQALADAARAAGLESLTLVPHCIGYRRISAPGITRQLYFVLFDEPAIAQFRRDLQTRRPAGAGAPGDFDPAALSPVLFIAATDPAFGRWLPLAADPATDCIAPLNH